MSEEKKRWGEEVWNDYSVDWEHHHYITNKVCVCVYNIVAASSVMDLTSRLVLFTETQRASLLITLYIDFNKLDTETSRRRIITVCVT